MEEDDFKESGGSSSAPSSSSTMTLEKAIDLGEYDPEYLGQFPQWHTLSRNIQFEYIRKALQIRNNQLIKQWAEITNILDFRLKPHLKLALSNIEERLERVKEDKERLYVEYSIA